VLGKVLDKSRHAAAASSHCIDDEVAVTSRHAANEAFPNAGGPRLEPRAVEFPGLNTTLGLALILFLVGVRDRSDCCSFTVIADDGLILAGGGALGTLTAGGLNGERDRVRWCSLTIHNGGGSLGHFGGGGGGIQNGGGSLGHFGGGGGGANGGADNEDKSRLRDLPRRAA